MPKPVKHGLNRNSFVMHKETDDGGDIYIVDQPEGFQFMVCDPYGRTRHFPEQNFINESEAMKAATTWWLANPLP